MEREFIPFENQYHNFFVLRVTKSERVACPIIVKTGFFIAPFTIIIDIIVKNTILKACLVPHTH